MPDEKPIGQKQAAHAAARTVMDMTGASRSEIRARFQGMVAENMQRLLKQPEAAAEKRLAPEVKVTSTALPSGNALTGGSDVATSPPTPPATQVPETLIVSNGSVYTATILCAGTPVIAP